MSKFLCSSPRDRELLVKVSWMGPSHLISPTLGKTRGLMFSTRLPSGKWLRINIPKLDCWLSFLRLSLSSSAWLWSKTSSPSIEKLHFIRISSSNVESVVVRARINDDYFVGKWAGGLKTFFKVLLFIFDNINRGDQRIHGKRLSKQEKAKKLSWKDDVKKFRSIVDFKLFKNLRAVKFDRS